MRRFLIILASLLPAALFAQNDRGTITGTIVDPANAVVPLAAVTARNLETGAVYETTATETGNYTIPSLVAGSYEVEAQAPGFSRFIQKGIRIQVAQVARIDIKLQIGSATESVLVSADAPLLRTENAEQSSTISRENLLNLPVNFSAVAGGGIQL